MGNIQDRFLNFLLEQANDTGEQNNKSLLHQELRNYFESDGKSIIKNLLFEYIDETLKSFEKSDNYLAENDSDIFLNNIETCAFLKIGRTSLYKHSKNTPNFPKPKHIGRRLVYSKQSLLDYLNRVKNYNREPP